MRMALTVLLLLTLAAGAIAQEGPWVITTDYSNFGRIRELAPEAPFSATDDLATIPGDAVGRYHDGLLYIVGRGGANLIQVYDPAADFELVVEYSLGSGLNLQDIAFLPDGNAYVSCYDSAVLLKIDPADGTILQSISTAAYADSDGLPETAWIHLHENKLYITCQLLDRGGWYAPTGPGLLLVLDTATDQWFDPVQLQGADPYTKIQDFTNDEGDRRLAVGCVGFYAVNDGGIEVIAPDTGASEGYLVTEAELGGDVLNFVFTGDESLHTVTSNSSFATSIVRMDMGSGLVSTVDTSTGYDHADLAWDGGFQLFVADRSTGASGVRVFDVASGAELTTSPVATGLPPFQFILDEASEVAPVPLPGIQSLAVSAPFPNPCNPRSEIMLSGQPGQQVRVSVVDLRGRRVQESRLILDGQGQADFIFTGENQQGHRLAAGVYRVVAEGTGGFASQSVVLVK